MDLVVTSPPYWKLRDYRDGGKSLKGQIGSEATPEEYIASLLRCTAEWARVLKPSGSIFVVLDDKYSQPGKGERNMQGVGGGITHKVRGPAGERLGHGHQLRRVSRASPCCSCPSATGSAASRSWG